MRPTPASIATSTTDGAPVSRRRASRGRTWARGGRVAEYEAVIGLEVHAQLLTGSKLFCGCSTEYGAAPNTHVCPVCLGLPGSLPVLNAHALALAVRAALAVDCDVQRESVFARKNYFYPDLPKGYQISQYEQPFCKSGHLDIEVDGEKKRVGITRIHMEEDAGKNVHGVGGDSVVNLNRAGVPLIEIVSEPDLRTSAEAAQYMRALREVLMSLGVNDGNLEEGSFRCDANVSIRPRGSDRFGTRTELKNLNSFRFVQKAIDTEIARHAAVVDAGGTIEQETRSYDPAKGTTATLRSKEDAHDYRYFPEPDLPPLVIDPEFVERQRRFVGELPAHRRRRYVAELGLTEQDAATLTSHPEFARFFEATLDALGGGEHLAKKAANWVQTEVLRGAKAHGLSADFPVTAAQLAELVKLVEAGDISGKQAKEVYAAVEGTTESPAAVVEARGMKVVSDEGALAPMCRSVLDANPKQVEQYRSGKTGVLGFFVGQVMKQSKGSANPKLVSEILKKLLES